MRRNETIVYYHGNDWNGVPGRQRLLMEAIAQYVPVVFLDGGRDKALRITHYQPCPNVTVVRGLISIVISFIRRGYYWMAQVYARAAMARFTLSSRKVVFWGAENYYRFHRFIPHDYFVHDAIDPCFEEEGVPGFQKREEEVTRKADVVFCTAEKLWENAMQFNERSYLLPNACSELDFTAEHSLALPDMLVNRGRPFVGYIGTIDSRLDLPYLTDAATKLPKATFVLVGPVLRELEPALTGLREMKNVIFAGPQFGHDAAAYARAFDVSLIPFVAGRVGDALNPVKMYTYLASGKPVVTTAIRECLKVQPTVCAEKSPADFTSAIRQAIQESENQELVVQRIDFARENMWRHRAETALKILRSREILSET